MMTQDRTTDIPEASNDVYHTWREASLLYQSSNFSRLLLLVSYMDM
jgi:hypothetical protein